MYVKQVITLKKSQKGLQFNQHLVLMQLVYPIKHQNFRPSKFKIADFYKIYEIMMR
jgi:hypothetical protein